MLVQFFCLNIDKNTDSLFVQIGKYINAGGIDDSLIFKILVHTLSNIILFVFSNFGGL